LKVVDLKSPEKLNYHKSECISKMLSAQVIHVRPVANHIYQLHHLFHKVLTEIGREMFRKYECDFGANICDLGTNESHITHSDAT